MFVPASRSAALDRLAHFVPGAGAAYAAGRNTDPGPDRPGAVSRLSPYLRHRLITEHEVVATVLAHHSLDAAEKFLQEVYWRTYWKGWLELRPDVWRRFLAERDVARQALAGSSALEQAEQGRTGIDAFDAWAHELAETGYLHNHARMWFASIWIFTLRLPWALGADFFLRHLIDADAASNTLSWRWVAGLQTAGKAYLATAQNIARYTDGRFAPSGLADAAVPLAEPPIKRAGALPEPASPDLRAPSLLLIHHEDFHPESLLPSDLPVHQILAVADRALLWGEGAHRFVQAATADAAERAAAHCASPAALSETLEAAGLLDAAKAAGVRQIVTLYAPVGPLADALARLAPQLACEGVALHTLRRPWDNQLWPHAKKGFFVFKTQIPQHLRAAGLV